MELLPLVQALFFMVCIVYWNKNIKQQKKLQIGAFFVRGIDQIRTDVQAFAELCLAARPRYLYAIRGANIKKYFTSPHFLSLGKTLKLI